MSLSESVFPAVPLAIDPVFVGSDHGSFRGANPTLTPRSRVSSCRQLSPWQLAISPMNSGLIAFPSTTGIVRPRKHFSVAPISKHRTSTSSHHDFSHESSLSFLPGVAPPAIRVDVALTRRDVSSNFRPPQLATTKVACLSPRVYFPPSPSRLTLCLFDQRNPRTQEEYIDIIDQLWALQIVHSTSDRFNTSDNPSLMFTTGDGNAKDIVALMLPITPDRLVVLRRRAATEAISDVASKEDASRFNGLQAVAADRFVFSTEPLEPADLEAMKRLDARFPFANGVLAQDWWRPNALNKFEPGFSFVEM